MQEGGKSTIKDSRISIVFYCNELKYWDILNNLFFILLQWKIICRCPKVQEHYSIYRIK